MQDERYFQWNDVALLTDQRACTFLCKTMLQIQTEDKIALQGINLEQWRLIESDAEDVLSVEMTLSLQLMDQQGKTDQMQVKIPLLGAVSEMVKLDEAKLLYSHGEILEDHLLLETVLQIRRELELQPTQVIVGQFAMEELLELPDNWPDCMEVLTTAASAEAEICKIEQQTLEVQGVYHLTIVYIDDNQIGEKLFAYQQHRPFVWRIAVPAGLHELSGAEPYYQSLSVQLLSQRQIQLTGNGVLCTLPADGMERDGLFDEAGQDAIAQPAAELVLESTATAENRQNHNLPHTPSVVNSRGSRRAKLHQYMRDLNGMVQSPTSIRNFEIGQESDDASEASAANENV